MKGIKTMDFVGFLITAVIFTFLGVGLGGFTASSAYAEDVSACEKRCKDISEGARKLAEEKTALEEKVMYLESELEHKQQNLDVLDDIIIRMRTKPEAEMLIKERLPYGMTNTIRYMDYTKLNRQSDQWRLQQECETGIAEGIRLYTSGEETYYCAALGSAYGRNLGDTWEVTLKNGTQFKIILAEYKDDGSTDYFGHPDRNYDGQECTNVIEFIVDRKAVPESVKKTGTYTALSHFGGIHGDGGNIVRMEYLGREWEP